MIEILIPRGMGLFSECDDCDSPICYWLNIKSPQALLELPDGRFQIRGFCNICAEVRWEEFRFMDVRHNSTPGLKEKIREVCGLALVRSASA